jgi:hypothetical protein
MGVRQLKRGNLRFHHFEKNEINLFARKNIFAFVRQLKGGIW